MTEMTMRERMLAVVQGRKHDRVPFVTYTDLGGPDEEVWAAIGRENMGLLQWCGVAALDTPNCRFEDEQFEQAGRQGIRRILHTPEGKLVEERLIQPTYGVAAAYKPFVREPEDYKPLLAYLRDATVRKHTDPLVQILDRLADDGLPHVAVLRTPFQKLWIEWVGIEDLCLHMVDIPGVMEEVFALLEAIQTEVFKVAAEAAGELPIPYIDVPDNITAPVIGERYFRRHCVPAYEELGALLDETGKDIPVFVHTDGDLKPLWGAIAESRVRGLDSMSPPPDNDTSVADAVRLWPEMRVCINFPSSVHLASPEKVYEHTMEILAQGGRTGRLQIQISENVPPGLWKRSYPQIVRAIRDFGAACR